MFGCENIPVPVRVTLLCGPFLGELAHWTGDPQDVFVMGTRAGAGLLLLSLAAAPPPPLLVVRSGNVDTGSGEQPQKPQESPEKRLGGRMRWSLGMCSEDSVTYLLAELGEPCLSQPLPPRPACPPPPPPTFPLFCSLTYANAPHLPSPPISFIDRLFAFLAPHWTVSSAI